MFKLLGAVLALYVLYAVYVGRVYVKHGPGGRAVWRDEEPRYFWVCVATYAGLTLALFTIF